MLDLSVEQTDILEMQTSADKELQLENLSVYTVKLMFPSLKKQMLEQSKMVPLCTSLNLFTACQYKTIIALDCSAFVYKMNQTFHLL